MTHHNTIAKRIAAFAIALTAAISTIAQTININFSSSNATVSVPSGVNDVEVQKNGAHVVITSTTTTTEYTYCVAGTTTNGSLTINGNYKLTLQLNGTNITSQQGAAIDVECGKRIAVEVTEGTVNTLADHTGGSHKATMYFTGHPEFSGNGTLNVTGNTKHAISAKEYLQIKRTFGTLNILAATSDGIHCGKEKVAEWDEEMTLNEHEFFLCNGGNINITNCGGDCIDSGNYGCMLIKGGTLNLTVNSDDANALKSPNTFILEDGQININITGTNSDGIYINNEARLLGGDINIDITGNGSKGIKGKKKATSAYPDGGNINIENTNINIVARGDDDLTDPADPSHCVGISVDGNLTVNNNTKVTAIANARSITCDGTKTGTAIETKQHWYANPYDYQYDMTAYFSLYINNEKALPANVELAAFVNNQCRGVGEPLNGKNDVYYMRIRSNTTSNETITLKIYIDGKEREATTTQTITFSNDTQVGRPSSPIVVNSTNTPDTYTVTITVSDQTMGTVEGAGTYNEGDQVNLQAIPNEGYHFTQWSDGDTNPNRTFTVTTSINLTAQFAPNQYTVTFIANNQIIAQTTQDYGTTITTPTPPDIEGYTFVSWGQVDATVPAHDVTYTATYQKNTEDNINTTTTTTIPAHIYTTNGTPTTPTHKGINIIVDKAGNTKKVINSK